MQAAWGFLSAVFWGVLLLSVLVFVHEGGHYLAARAFGVRVTEFFLGLPCRARLSFKSKKVGTEIGVTPLLLGGYNRISGMEPATDELLAPCLAAVMREGRVAVADAAAELGCDEERIYGLMATLVDWGSIRAYYDAELGEMPSQKTWPAAFETLARDGRGLTEYDRGHDFSLPGSTAAGEPCDLGLSAEDLLARERSHTYLGCGFIKRVAMLVAGPAVNVLLAFFLVVGVLMVQGVSAIDPSPVLGAVEEGSIAESAGIRAGDRVVCVGEEQTPTWADVVTKLRARLAGGSDFTMTVERDGRDVPLLVDLPEGQQTDAIGVHATVVTYHPTLAEASAAAVGYAGQVASFAARLIMPQHTMEVLDQSSSVVGIAAMASEAASSGVWDFLNIAAALSMSLGFMNLLPIPPLDGGKILVELIQLALRRELSLKVQNAISYVGLAFFLFVFVFVLRNDILRLL